jgi:hypothetical protein
MSFLENTNSPVVNFTLSRKKTKLKICSGGKNLDSIIFNLHENQFKELDIQSPEIEFQDFPEKYSFEFIQKLESIFYLGNDVSFVESIITSTDPKEDCKVTYSIPWIFNESSDFKVSPLINLLSRIPNSAKISIGINGLLGLKIDLMNDDCSLQYYQAPLTA